MPERLCSIASGFFALSSWPLLYRFLSRSTLHLPKLFSTQSAVAVFWKFSQWTQQYFYNWPSQVCVTVTTFACLWVMERPNLSAIDRPAKSSLLFLTASLAVARRVIRHLSLRGTSKIGTWLFLNLNYLSKAQVCWNLCCFDKRKYCCLLPWAPEQAGVTSVSRALSLWNCITLFL